MPRRTRTRTAVARSARLLLLLLLFALRSGAALQAQSILPAGAPPEVIVAGRGEVRTAPDEALIELSIQGDAPKAAAAAAENSRRVASVREALLQLGLTPDVITVASYGVRSEYTYDGRNQTQRFTGYAARSNVRVRLTDLTRVGPVIDAALAAGATQVQEVRYATSRESTLQNEALAAAVTQARTRAGVMAAAAGGTLGPLRQLTSEANEQSLGIQRAAVDRVSFSESRGPPALSPSDLIITVIVLGRWQFLATAPPPR